MVNRAPITMAEAKRKYDEDGQLDGEHVIMDVGDGPLTVDSRPVRNCHFDTTDALKTKQLADMETIVRQQKRQERPRTGFRH